MFIAVLERSGKYYLLNSEQTMAWGPLFPIFSILTIRNWHKRIFTSNIYKFPKAHRYTYLPDFNITVQHYHIMMIEYM